ncbi:MAG: hypothetical protein ACJAWA_000943 [Nonlabens sp.]|jgi:hypothetical protein
MKTKAIVFLCAVGIFFSSFKTIDQELKNAVVIYDGYEYEEFNFTISGTEYGENSLLSFTVVPEEILKSFDLESYDLIGESFKITYEVVSKKTVNGEFSLETYVLKTLKKVE